MSEYLQKQHGHDCHPPITPADQPAVPGNEKKCVDPDHAKTEKENELPSAGMPKSASASKNCGHSSTSTASNPECFEKLMKDQSIAILAGKKSEEFFNSLKTQLANAKDGKSKYTQDVYKQFLKQWQEQDESIARLLQKLVCTVPCWRSVLECHVCPLLQEITNSEDWLNSKGYCETHPTNPYDVQYWLTRRKAARQKDFDRVSSVLSAWMNPADTFTKVLSNNAKLHDNALATIGKEPGKAIYPVFLQLVPMHLAIAPPRDPNASPTANSGVTKIDKSFTDFCNWLVGCPETCCGPDLGKWSLRQRIIGVQPYLIDPNNYFDLICCLVTTRWAPARERLTAVTAALEGLSNEITKQEANFKYDQFFKEAWVKTFETNATSAIPSAIDCCDYKPLAQPEHQPQQPHTPCRSY